jgi:thioredoxin-related protein
MLLNLQKTRIKNMDFKRHKILQKSILSIVLLSSIFLALCCKDNKEIDNEELIDKEINEENNNKVIEFKIKFPDTLYVNQPKDGVIQYKSVLDTITTTFGEKEKNRYTRFILTTTDSINYDYKHLKQSVKDTFGAINNRTIPFYNIKFTKPGIYYIDGLINDIVVIDLHTNDSEGNEMFRLIENDERVTHKVVVIERPILGNVPLRK